ncbi:universal stress protein [Undibacterium sp.]|uniref:universal stress protein n=1 Tax=Undibacterium sp. TaxID=1914977 RepID=UPI00374DB791
MYTHILLPTDGTASSKDAIRQCMRFAKSLNAKVTGLHVVPQYHMYSYQPEMLDDSSEKFTRECQEQALRYLSDVELEAKEFRIDCSTLILTNDHPYEAIIHTAQSRGCDLIAMASHGRKGIKALLLSSETQKVLAHSKIPVLVYR